MKTSSFKYTNQPLGVIVRQQNNNSPPVSEGDEVDVSIASVGDKGDGVARVEGFVVFVPGTKKGDRVRIKIKKVLASVAFGEKIGEAQSPAPERPRKSEDEFSDIDFDSLGEGSEDFGDGEPKE